MKTLDSLNQKSSTPLIKSKNITMKPGFKKQGINLNGTSSFVTSSGHECNTIKNAKMLKSD
jgi:hypothetical protein